MPREHENEDEDREPDADEQLRQAEDDEEPIEKRGLPNPVGDDAQNGDRFEDGQDEINDIWDRRGCNERSTSRR
jgi:hypothetical protein